MNKEIDRYSIASVKVNTAEEPKTAYTLLCLRIRSLKEFDSRLEFPLYWYSGSKTARHKDEINNIKIIGDVKPCPFCRNVILTFSYMILMNWN